MAQPKCQIIVAPTRTTAHGTKSVFLAGSTTKIEGEDNWRRELTELLGHLPITLYNPFGNGCDSSWVEDIEFAPYREQVEWELDMQEKADIVVVYFHPASQAPVSLLELGLCARDPGKAIVVCPQGYWKRGNVQLVCAKYGVEMAESLVGVREAIEKRLLSASSSTASDDCSSVIQKPN